ncbi:MAG: hypothetical protein H0T62_04085 [Parachlamydiaceae bacterium]|nr:hypothetical protein [Parachlamydiaceae bacterium]
MDEFNNKFSKKPRGQFDAHRPIDSDCDLKRILARCEVRTLTKDLSFSFHSRYSKIVEPQIVNRLNSKKIEIRQDFFGNLRVFYEERELKFAPIEEFIETQEARLVDNKDKELWKPKKTHCPRRNHPWKRNGYRSYVQKK